MRFHGDASIIKSRKSGHLRLALLYGIPSLTVIFFLLHSRLIILLEKDLQRNRPHQHQGISGIIQLYQTNVVDDNNNLGVCQKLLINGNEHATPSSVWWNSKQRLLSAVMGKDHDEGSSIPVWMQELWKFLTPWNLQQTTFPQVNPIILQRILNKLRARQDYLQNGQNKDKETTPEPPKIQVLVFGGSVAEGVGCDAPPPSYLMTDEEKEQSPWKVSSLQECSWPHLLQQLADAVLPNAIEIHNLAVGGTHSRAAVPILEHGLYPPRVHVNENHHVGLSSESHHHHFDPPDIILNAYAANDNLPPAFYNTDNTTSDNFHKYRVLKRLMEFIEAASGCESSAQPWIVFVNDYMGNQQESLVGESAVDELVQLLMQTVSVVSYVSPVRLLEPYVWANTTEHVWSGVWKKKRKNKGQEDSTDDYKVDVHYGMAGHMTTAMVAAHAFFHWTMEYCQEQVLFGHHAEGECSSSNWMSSSLPQRLQETRIQAHALSSVLNIDLPSKEWMKANHPDRVYPNITEGSKVSKSDESTLDCTSGRQQSCAFAFLAAPLGTHSKKGPLQEYIDYFTLPDNDGSWQVQNNFRHGGFQNKLGLVATRTGAQLELIVPINPGKKYMKLTIHYLKSYGPDWANSRMRGTIQVRQPKEGPPDSYEDQTFELEGFHDQQVSISYTHVVPKIPVNTHGSDGETKIRLKFDLIGGSNFKINAMMLC